MMSRATYQGLYKRDAGTLRPFILTRSSYMGTQKYSAKWTGDSLSTFSEMRVSINQLMSLGISGVSFVGADIPGFYG